MSYIEVPAKELAAIANLLIIRIHEHNQSRLNTMIDEKLAKQWKITRYLFGPYSRESVEKDLKWNFIYVDHYIDLLEYIQAIQYGLNRLPGDTKISVELDQYSLMRKTLDTLPSKKG